MSDSVTHRSSILARGLSLRCPNCGSSGLFRGWLRLRYRCTACGLKLSRSEGFFLGAMVWNYGMTVFGVLAPLVVLGFLGNWGLNTVVIVCGVAGILVPVLLYRLAWSLWLMSYYIILPHELPANAGDNASIDEDE